MSDGTLTLSAEEIASLVQPVCDAVENISDATMHSGRFQIEPVEMDEEIQLNTAANAKGFVNPENRRQFAIRAQLTLTLSNSKKQTIAVIEAVYAIRYETREDFPVSDIQADAYAQYNGIFNAWSYWREFVHSSCNRMGIAVPPVPVYRQGMTAVLTKLVTEDPSNVGKPAELPKSTNPQ